MSEAGKDDELLVSTLDETDLASLNLLEPRDIDWPRVERTVYLVHQHLRYEYAGPIEDLDQRLMILPPAQHGDQRSVMHRLETSIEPAHKREHHDRFGNVVVNMHVARVEQAIDFEAWIVVERRPRHGPLQFPASLISDPRARQGSALTAADATLRQAAASLMATGDRGQALAERIGAWTHDALHYEYGVTDIHTTGAEALAYGKGVCQDYAHLMLAMCRLCRLPARYVSGHLLGVGGTHAWVEVLLPHQEIPGMVIAWPYDPSNGCPAGLHYVTIAIGRDYRDVAPTSGTYRASHHGTLRTHKVVGLTAAEYAPGAASTA
jgi:transglutaminase-like putative cysteine protease